MQESPGVSRKAVAGPSASRSPGGVTSRNRTARASALLFAGAVTSCAASFQTMYEGDVMFEHCYRLDIDATVGSSEKRSCWERWLSTHVRGQTRDRVEFAAGRSRALIAGSAASSVAVLGPGTVPGIEPVGTTSVACPLPETPFEAPPSTAPAPPKASAAARASASAAPAPPPAVAARKGKPCLDACTSDLSQCAGKCTAARCSQRCADDVKRCMTACL